MKEDVSADQPTSWPSGFMPKPPAPVWDVLALLLCFKSWLFVLLCSPSSDDWAVHLLILNGMKSPPLPFEKEIALPFPFDSTV